MYTYVCDNTAIIVQIMQRSITQDLLNLDSVLKMEEGQERMDCSDSEMIPSSPREIIKNAMLAKGLSLMMI